MMLQVQTRTQRAPMRARCPIAIGNRMRAETNPYESPLAAEEEVPAPELRRPAIGTFLICVWVLEGGLKASLLVAGLARGFNPLESLARDYLSWNRLVFFL